MSVQRYEVIIRATGEVRDKDGALISSEPVELRYEATQEEIDALTVGNVEPPKGEPS